MQKIDFKKDLTRLYNSRAGKFETVEVPPMSFLMIDGQGDPNTSKEYMDAIQTLYPLAYTLKFMSKKELDKDFTVMPLESLWWTDDITQFSMADKDEWKWTAMIMMPEFVTDEMFERARDDVRKKKAPASIDKVRFGVYDEGRSAQVVYIGPYADEGPTIQRLHGFIKEQGGELTASNKHHHEIYLGDPRRTDPSKLRTIIRQPY